MCVTKSRSLSVSHLMHTNSHAPLPVCLYSYMYGSDWEFYSTCPHCQWFPVSSAIIFALLISPLLGPSLLPPAFPRLWFMISSQLCASVSRFLTVCSMWAEVNQVAPIQMCTCFDRSVCDTLCLVPGKLMFFVVFKVKKGQTFGAVEHLIVSQRGKLLRLIVLVWSKRLTFV